VTPRLVTPFSMRQPAFDVDKAAVRRAFGPLSERRVTQSVQSGLRFERNLVHVACVVVVNGGVPHGPAEAGIHSFVPGIDGEHERHL